MTYAALPIRRLSEPALETFLSFMAYCFLLFVVVDVDPFREESFQAVMRIAKEQAEGGDSGGNLLLHLVLGTLSVLIFPVLLYRRMLIWAVLKNNLLLIGILGWCLASTTWAIEPGMSFRRAVGLVLMTLITAVISTLKPDNLLKVLLWVTGTYMAVDYIGILTLPADNTIQFDGAWRGLHSQKNAAGYCCVLAVLVWFHAGMARRNPILLVGAALWTLFLIKTVSKTSMELTAALIPFYFLLTPIIRRGSGQRHLALFLLLLLILIPLTFLILLIVSPEVLANISFTGRTIIWSFVWHKITQAPLFGWGYDSFWGIGAMSPALIEADYKSVGAFIEGHNGYLDTVVTIGIFGFIPVLIFMIRPLVLFFLRDYRGLDSSEQTLVGLFISFLFFAMLHNFMESGMLRGMSPIWTFGLLAILYMSTLNARLKGTASP